MCFVLLFAVTAGATLCWVSDDLIDAGQEGEDWQTIQTACGYGEMLKRSTYSKEKVDLANHPRNVFYLSESETNTTVPVDDFVDAAKNDAQYLDVHVHSAKVVPTLVTSRSEFGVCPPTGPYWEDDSCRNVLPLLTLGKSVAEVKIQNTNQDMKEDKIFVSNLIVESDTLKVVSGSGNRPIVLAGYTVEIGSALYGLIESKAIQVEAYEYKIIFTPKTVKTELFPLLEEKLRRGTASRYYDYEVYKMKRLIVILVDDTSDKTFEITYGKRQIKITVNGGSAKEEMIVVADEDARIGFEAQYYREVQAVITCDDGLTSDDIVGGEWDCGSIWTSLVGNWPKVDGIPVSDKYNTTYETIDGIQYSVYHPGHWIEVDSSRINISSASLPVTIRNAQKLWLERNNVRIQGSMGFSYQCTCYVDGPTVLDFAGPSYSSFSYDGTVEGGDLTFQMDSCGAWIQARDLSVSCRKLDLTEAMYPSDRLASGIEMLENGKIEMVHGGIDITAMYMVFEEYSNNHNHQWCDFENKIVESLWSDWKYILDFVKSEATGLVDGLMKDCGVKMFTLRNFTYSGKQEMQIWRSEVPIYELYSQDLMPLVCLKKGQKMNDGDWSVKNPTSGLMYSGTDMTKYFPKLGEFALTGTVEKMVDGEYECLGYKLKSIPNSAFQVVLYIANQSLIDAFSGLSKVLTIVTPSTIDKEVTLHNPRGRNVLLICFDDVPSGKSIDLWSMRLDANLFVVGLPSRAVYDGSVFKALNDMIVSDADFKTAVQPLVDKYKGYLPKISLKIHHLETIVMALCDFVGSSIDCEIFVAALCHFSQIGDTNIVANYVAADTSTYDSMKSKTFKTLVLVPVSMSPPDYLSISSIEFDVGKWRLIGSGFYNFISEQSNVQYEVDTSRVDELYIISTTDQVSLAIPTNSKVSSVKGVSLIMDLNTDNMYTAPPASPLLSTDAHSRNITDTLKRLVSRVFGPMKQKTTRSTGGKSASFTGNWNQVTEVTGTFGVDAGAASISVADVPTKVVAALQVKSNEQSEVNLPQGVENVKVNVPVLVVSGQQSLSYGQGVADVTFDNLTFNGGRATSVLDSSLTLTVSKESKPLVVKHVKCLDYSDVSLSDLKLSESLDMGIGSSLTANENYDQSQLSVSMHYTLTSLFNSEAPKFTAPSKAPKQVIFVYDNDEASVDLSQYLKKDATILTLANKDTCKKWLSASTFSAENPNFAGSSSAVQAKCTESSLVLSLQKVPNPTPIPELPPKPDEDSPVNVGAIVGGVIGALAAVAIAVVVVLLVIRRRKSMLNNSTSSGMSNETVSSAE